MLGNIFAERIDLTICQWAIIEGINKFLGTQDAQLLRLKRLHCNCLATFSKEFDLNGFRTLVDVYDDTSSISR